MKIKKISHFLMAVMVLPYFSGLSVLAEKKPINDAYDKQEEVVKETKWYKEKKITLKAKKSQEFVEPTPIDYEILIDGSGSMRDTGSLETTKAVLKDFINTRNKKTDRVGLSVFRGPGYDTVNNTMLYEVITDTISDYDNNFDELNQKIDGLKSGGLTPLLDGLNHSLNKMNTTSRKDARKVLIVFSDGHPNIGPKRDYVITKNALRGAEQYINPQVNYPGNKAIELRKEIDEFYEKGDIESDLYLQKEKELNELDNKFPLGYKNVNFDNPSDRVNKDFEGRRYENHIQEFYDLADMITKKATDIKKQGYEVYTIYLDNSKSDSYSKIINKNGEVESLFKNMAQDSNHYFSASNVNLLSQSFKELDNTIKKYTYEIHDDIEQGYTLMPETIKSDKDNVLVNHDDKQIQWTSSGVDYEELTVSYHIYKEISEGNVVVKHVDESGKELVEPETKTDTVGEKYETTSKEIPEYELVTTPTNANGEFKEGTQEVIYVYKPKADVPSVVEGTIVVKHVDESGKAVAKPETKTDEVGKKYETESKEIPGYELVTTPTNATGEFKEGTQEVIYVYKPKADVPSVVEGTVVVKHVDESGKAVAKPETKTDEVGKKYETESKEISGYELVTTPTNATGEFKEGTQEVIYVYKPKADVPSIVEGTVVVKHVDESGKAVAKPETKTDEVGKKYETESKEIPGYELVTTPTNATGEFKEGTQEVIYVYKPKADVPSVVEGTVVVKHVDESGKAVAKPETKTDEVGKKYETESKEIPGYELVITPTNATGEFKEGTQEVIYVYKPKADVPSVVEGTVVVKHVDESGKAVAKPETKTDEVGKKYETESKEIPGYELVITPTNATGEFKEGTQEVIYVYKPKADVPSVVEGTVVVKHVDESGKAVAKPETKTDEVGKKYETESKEIPGYELVITPTNATGEFKEGTQEVIYVYKPKADVPSVVEGTVVVKHVDESGKAVAKPETKTDEVGKKYETESKEIPGYELVTTPTNATGEFKEGTQEVIYVYKPIKQIITKEGNSNETNTIEKPSSKPISQDVIKYEKKNNNVVSKNELTKTLPKTGDIEKINYLLMGLISVIGSFGMLILRRKK
ncbi:MucBP domain-containing protein [Vagococcus luciliae]|uniref:VWFA domain-containing protein n=1 Tax=Vagococcus luciliae TaxID=2920380 RepID=A0ABY5NZA0_9ENTE|nr:MucBP domain-containing protein [Vagococcus luciliae]UUV98889.1 hypothetical protein G314FT_10470 [Vagococcus luciliae]